MSGQDTQPLISVQIQGIYFDGRSSRDRAASLKVE
ncbi:MAG: hypothetical protein JWQ08_2226, partial [Deinococcus sp.]|nr:hypothetical protein [Deinococcus sp.]